MVLTLGLNLSLSVARSACPGRAVLLLGRFELDPQAVKTEQRCETSGCVELRWQHHWGVRSTGRFYSTPWRVLARCKGCASCIGSLRAESAWLIGSTSHCPHRSAVMAPARFRRMPRLGCFGFYRPLHPPRGFYGWTRSANRITPARRPIATNIQQPTILLFPALHVLFSAGEEVPVV